MLLRTLTIFTVIVLLFISCKEEKKEVTELKTQKEKASYTIGYDIGQNVAEKSYDIDLKTLYKGIEDGISGKQALLSSSERTSTMEMYEIERQKRVKRKMEEQGEINKVEGEKFLAENKNREGIVTFRTGVQMEVIEAGTGKQPTRGDIVVFHFIGKFLDGTIFDQTLTGGKPLEMPVAQLLPGQQQALIEMREGGKAIVFIPPNMAFGSYGGGELIPPHTTLVYEMELIEVKKMK